MEFRVLGPLEALDHDRPVIIGPPRNHAVLGMLLATPNHFVSIDRLVEELWQRQCPPDARSLVHLYVSRVRRALRQLPGGTAARRLITRKPGYLLWVDDEELDLCRFERLLLAARHARRTKQLDNSLALYRKAHVLWRGEPFETVPRTHTITAQVAALTELRSTGLEEQYDVALDAGYGPDLVADLTALVGEYPLRERLVAQLMRAQYRAARTADALATYHETRQRLSSELGIEPGPLLRRVHLAILRGEQE